MHLVPYDGYSFDFPARFRSLPDTISKSGQNVLLAKDKALSNIIYFFFIFLSITNKLNRKK